MMRPLNLLLRIARHTHTNRHDAARQDCELAKLSAADPGNAGPVSEVDVAREVCRAVSRKDHGGGEESAQPKMLAICVMRPCQAFATFCCDEGERSRMRACDPASALRRAQVGGERTRKLACSPLRLKSSA